MALVRSISSHRSRKPNFSFFFFFFFDYFVALSIKVTAEFPTVAIFVHSFHIGIIPCLESEIIDFYLYIYSFAYSS